MQPRAGLVAVIDDDAATRLSIERLLGAAGYATEAFASAEEFLRSGVVHRATSLVVDVHLGGMSGIELHRHLNARRVKVPVVFITGTEDAATRAAALSLGFVDYLLKPFDAAFLLGAVERCGP